MRIAILAAGAGGMYCGSCMRDNTLAAALKRAGHAVTLVPLYTPIKTDERNVSEPEVFYGGLNVYLQHASKLFRHTPRVVDWLLDRPGVLNVIGLFASATRPEKLGSLTVSVLDGEHGPQVKELGRLSKFLREQVVPDVVLLPNAMFLGLAATLRRELHAPVVCELSGEDVFLDQLAEPHRTRAIDIVRNRAGDVDRFVAASRYYADHMAGFLGVPRRRIEVVYPGVAVEDLSISVSASAAASPARGRADRPANGPPVVGYLARICPEKGLAQLVEAVIRLRQNSFRDVQLRAAGWLGSGDREWFDRHVAGRAIDSELAGGFAYLGEVDRAGKRDLLAGIDVLCVPTQYPEAKGIYVLEALAAGVPVVQPGHGAFPELIEDTGGGILVPPGGAEELADGLVRMLSDPARRAAMGRAGQAAVRARFTDAHMARAMMAVFDGVLAGRKRG